MAIATKYIYNFNKKLNLKGEALVQLRIGLNRQYKYHKTGIYLKPEDWDEAKQRVKPSHNNHLALNKALNRLEESVGAYFWNERAAERVPGLQEVLDYLKRGDQPEQTFTSFVEAFIARMDLKPGTIENHKDSLRVLNEFRASVAFKDINYAFLVHYKEFLKARLTNRGEPMKKSTISRVQSHLKKWIKEAVALGHIKFTSNPFLQTKIEKVKGERKPLTAAEVNKLEQFFLVKGLPPQLDEMRDIILTVCYTGMAYADLFSLTQEELPMQKGATWIWKSRTKSGQPVRLPISHLFKGKPLRIIRKHQAEAQEAGRSTIFRKRSPSWVSRWLNRLAEACGIKRHIVLHEGRHTFATLLDNLNLPKGDLQALLAHASERSTNIYVKVLPERLVGNLDKVEWDKIKQH